MTNNVSIEYTMIFIYSIWDKLDMENKYSDTFFVLQVVFLLPNYKIEEYNCERKMCQSFSHMKYFRLSSGGWKI